MNQQLGQENMAFVERWPLKESGLYWRNFIPDADQMTIL